MNSDERKRRNRTRAIYLLSKLDAKKGEAWLMPALLAYCQGRAFELGEDEASLSLGGDNTQDGGKRKRALKAGLLAMIEELVACIEVLGEEDYTSDPNPAKRKRR